MADFTKPDPIGTLAAIGKITIIALSQAGADTIWARIEVTNAANEVLRSFDGDLTPYLNLGQVNQVLNLLAAVRTKAAAEML